MTGGVRFATGIVEGIFKLLRKAIQIVRVSFVPVVKFISLVCIIALLLSGVAAFTGLSLSSSLLSAAGPESFAINKLGLISLFFLIGIPILGLVAFFLKLAFKTKIQKEITFTAWTLWFISLFFVSYSGTMFAMDMQKREQLMSQNKMVETPAEIEILTWNDGAVKTLDAEWLTAPIHVVGDSIYIHNVYVEYIPSDQADITIEKVIKARGINKEKAVSRAEQVISPYKIEGNKIFISPVLRMPGSLKWRDQRVEYKIYVPKETKVKMEYRNGCNGDVKIDWDSL